MNKFFTLIAIALIIIVAYAFFTAVDVFAHGADLKPNACRTYYVNSIYGGVDNVDGLNCGMGTDDTQTGHNAQNTVKMVDTSNTVVTVDTVSNDVQMDDNTPTVQNDDTQQTIEQDNTPSVDNTPTVESDKGNPGNIKGVGNAGENPNGKDTMPIDNAGGNGNGEHGNQGQGGHS